MGCSSCGKRRAQSGGVVGRDLYDLVTSDGKKRTYATESEARKAQSRLGGTVSKQQPRR